MTFHNFFLTLLIAFTDVAFRTFLILLIADTISLTWFHQAFALRSEFT